MNDNDIEIGKENEISKCRQNFSEVKFSLRKLVVSQQLIDNLKNNVKACLSQKIKEEFQLKLQFICAESNTSLKQIITKASIKQTYQNDRNITFEILQNQSTFIKVLYLCKPNSQILINIYIATISNDDKKTLKCQFIGCIILNPEEINKKVKQRIKQIIFRKVQVQPFIHRINLTCQNQKQDYQQASQAKYKNFYNKNKEGKYSRFHQQFSSKQKKISHNSFLQLRVFHSQKISQVIELFRIEQLKKSNHKKKELKLQIVSHVINEKVISKFILPQITNRRQYLERNQHQNYLPSTRSQFALKTLSNNNFFNGTKNIKLGQSIKSNEGQIYKKFKQKIYELLQEVKLTKKDFKIQNYQNINQSYSIKIKNIYCNISQKRKNQSQANQIFKDRSQVYESFQTNVVNSIMPVTSFPSIRHSKSQQYFHKNKDELIIGKQRYQRLFRIQKRLQNHQKIAALSNQYLHQMYLNQNLA